MNSSSDRSGATYASQPADWLHDPLPNYYTRPLFEVGGLVVGTHRDEALEVKAIVEEDNRPFQGGPIS